MKKGHLKIDVHIKENENENPYFWCICEWTGRTWYNTGHSGRAKTANLAWEQARREYIKIYDSTTKCKNCSNEATYGDVCSDCVMDRLHYRLNNQKETIVVYQKWLREYVDMYGKLEGMKRFE